MLDGFRGEGSLSEGVDLPNGGKLKIAFYKNGHGGETPSTATPWTTAFWLLAASIQKAQPKNPTILVSKDINLRIKADALGLQAEDYETDRVFITDLYTGMMEMPSAPKKSPNSAPRRTGIGRRQKIFSERILHAHRRVESQEGRALTKVDATGTKLVPIIDCREGVWGIKPRNREQHFAFDALLDDRIKLVTLMGKAGTGKTLLAMAAGLKRVVNDREFRRLVVARPTISMGKELGFLPGSLEEKLAPWMQPIHDALEMLSDLNMGHDHRRSGDLMRRQHRRRGVELHPRPQHRQPVHDH
jgi:PhoH-like ATPase